MAYFETNNDFFGYTGTINRKNYVINMAILLTVFFGLSFINFSWFEQITAVGFLVSILAFIISCVKFVAIFAMLSLVYRRLADISKNKSYKFALNMKRLFVLIFVFPVVYFTCIQMFIYQIPLISNILSLLSLFILAPAAIISAAAISIIK